MVQFSDPVRLSETGSTRATAYNWSNKSITRDGRTHVVWLDAIATVCGCTYDHRRGQWGEVHRLFEGADNHANPCLTMDEAGHLRIAWGPHGWFGDWNQARVKWAISTEPGRIDQWEREANFGYNATGPNLIHTPAGFDALVCRGGEPPAASVFHRQRAEGGWTSARPLMHQEIEPQYTHHYTHIACASDGTLYAACHFYNVGGGDNRPVGGDRSRMGCHGMGVLRSDDMGATWTNLSGEPVTTPTVYTPRIAIPPAGANLRVFGITTDSKNDLWALTGQQGQADGQLRLCHWNGTDWREIALEGELPADRSPSDGFLTIDSRDRLHITASALRRDGESGWGHPSNEIFYLFSKDGGAHFECQMATEPDDSLAHWLPNLSRPGPFHPVDQPLLLYTRGEPGKGCRPDTQTEVWARFVHVDD